MTYPKFFLRIASFVLLLIPLSVRADGFVVTPMMQEVILPEDEEEQSMSVSVRNDTSTQATFEITVLDFGSLDESGGVAFLGVTGDLDRHYALAAWMQLPTKEIRLASGEEQTLEVKIQNREDLAPGGHYGAVVFRNVSNVKTEGPTVAINQFFTSLVMLKKTGGARYGLTLDSVQYQDRWFTLERTVIPRFKNVGNVHVAPRGELRVTDPLGRLVARGILNEGSGILLPESIREYPLNLFPISRAFLPGWYTLELSYRYDGLDTTSDWSRQFFLFPPFLSAVLAGGVTGGVFLLLWRRRRLSQFKGGA